VIKRTIEERKWKFSQIAGDPDLGKATFCYGTRWFEDQDEAVNFTTTYKEIFEMMHLSVVRVKVEQVIHDERLINGKWKQL
jgi:hypothetical protein